MRPAQCVTPTTQAGRQRCPAARAARGAPGSASVNGPTGPRTHATTRTAARHVWVGDLRVAPAGRGVQAASRSARTRSGLARRRSLAPDARPAPLAPAGAQTQRPSSQAAAQAAARGVRKTGSVTAITCCPTGGTLCAKSGGNGVAARRPGSGRATDGPRIFPKAWRPWRQPRRTHAQLHWPSSRVDPAQGCWRMPPGDVCGATNAPDAALQHAPRARLLQTPAVVRRTARAWVAPFADQIGHLSARRH